MCGTIRTAGTVFAEYSCERLMVNSANPTLHCIVTVDYHYIQSARANAREGEQRGESVPRIFSAHLALFGRESEHEA